MKLKLSILALTACSIAILPAQTAPPEKPTSEKTEQSEKAQEPVAETPVEKLAFKVFALLDTLPEIMGSIKDEATLTAAEAKLGELVKKIEAEEANLLKLEVPDHAARMKLSKKLKFKEKALNEKMMPAMMSMQKLDPSVAAKVAPMMQKFGAQMQENETSMNKYFQPDKAKGEKG